MARARVFKFSSVLRESRNRLWGCHFGVPAAIGNVVLSGGTSRRVVCRLNDSVEYQCALLPDGEGAFLITLNKQRQRELHVKPGSGVLVELWKDNSTFGLPMPEELEELLRQDPAGKQLFFALSPGKQRTLLYIVGKAKDGDLRMMRSNIIIRHLIAHSGRINYRILSSELKPRR